MLNDATAELQKHQRAKPRHLQEYQQGVRRHLSEAQHEVQVPRFASGEEVEHLRHELSQSLAEGSYYQNQSTTSRSGASESSSEIQQSRQERDHLNVHGHNLETETQAGQSAVRSHEAQVVQILQMRGMIHVERLKLNSKGGSSLSWSRQSTALSQFRWVEGRGCPVASSLALS